MSNIGLLNEKPLHASLKKWIARPGDRFEVPVDGFVVDIVRDGLLVEIQTGNFSSIKHKLKRLVRTYKIRLVYPIAYEKWIVKPSKDKNSGFTRRKSPKRGRVEDLFSELMRLPRILENPNFSLEILLIREEEVRRYDGWGKWHRKGWGIEERRFLEVVDRRVFKQPADLKSLLPDCIEGPFTNNELAEAMGTTIQAARMMTYCMRKMRVIDLIGKRGHAHLYNNSDS